MRISDFFGHRSLAVGFALLTAITFPVSTSAAPNVKAAAVDTRADYRTLWPSTTNPSFTADNTTPPVTTGVDWPNALYFITCDGIAAHPFAVQLSNGKGSTPGAAAGVRSDRLDVALEAVATGDLLNDGSAETAVLLSCSPQPSNGYVEEVRAFTSEGNFIGELPSPQSLVDPSAIPPAPVYIPSELSMQSGYLSAGMMFYGPGDSHATGPSIHRTITWKWDGESFTLACDG